MVVRRLRESVVWVRFPAPRQGYRETGCRIEVVRMAGGHVAWVRFPAARQIFDRTPSKMVDLSKI